MKELWKNKKFKRNLLLAGTILFILICMSVYTVAIKPNLSKETYVYKEETVTRGDLILGIMESGSLSLGESSLDYDLNLDLEDDEDDDSDDDSSDEEEEDIRYLEIQDVYVVNGQRVKEGDLLFQFTQDSVSGVTRKLNAALAEAQIALSEAQTEYNISLMSAKGTYDSGITAGSRAQADYQAALNVSAAKVNSIEGEIKNLQLEIENAQEKLADEDILEAYKNAKTAFTQAKNKYEETDLHNATAYTSNRTDYEDAKKQLEQLEEELQGYRETISDNQEEIESLQNEIQTAKANQIIENQQAENQYNSDVQEGELAEKIYAYSTDSLSDDVNLAQTELDEIQQKVDAFEAFTGTDGKVYAKEDGLVTSVAYEAGDDLISEGKMITYTKEDDYTVSIDVSEEDVAAIQVGDQVDISFTAYEDKTWKGTIISITTSATSDHASTISYPVTIHVEGDTSLLYGGMTADVTFVTDSVSDVLYVSKKAVFEEDGKTYVYRQTASGKREQTEVETGFADMSSIEIISGLNEGDIVYIKSIMSVSNERSQKQTDSDISEDSNPNGENTSPEDAFGSGGPSGNMPQGEMPEGDFPQGEFPGSFGGNRQ